MPFYPDPQFNVRYQHLVMNLGTVGTATVSGANSLTSAVTVPYKPIRTGVVSAVRVYVNTAPAANYTVGTIVVKNGTSTMAVATIGTHTAGEFVDATVTAANATLSVQPTIDFIGTSTASAQTSGVYSMWFETTEQYA